MSYRKPTLAATAIVHQQVRRSLGVRNNRDGQLKNPGRDLLGRPKAALQASEVADEPGDEGRGKAGAVLSDRAVVRPEVRAADVAAGSEDVDLGAVAAAAAVFLVGARAVGLRHAHDKGLWQPLGRRVVGHGLVVVACCHDGEDALVVGG